MCVTVQVVRDVLKETWEEVQQELERYNAALPAGTPAYIAQQPQVSDARSSTITLDVENAKLKRRVVH